MLEVDVERGEGVDPEAVDLRDVVFVACGGAGGRRAGGGGVFDEAAVDQFRLLCCGGVGAPYLSRKFSNSSATFSPTLSTTLGTALAIGSRGRFLSVPRAPTTSSSGNPSTSLSAPLLSEGGIEEREARRPLGILEAPLRRDPAARSSSGLSEVKRPSTTEDMMRGWMGNCSVQVGGVSTRCDLGTRRDALFRVKWFSWQGLQLQVGDLRTYKQCPVIEIMRINRLSLIF